MAASDEDDLRRQAEARVDRIEAFRIHLAIYVAVNALLWLIWAYTGATTNSPWPVFVTLGWGIGIVAHWWSVYGHSADRREARVQAEIDRLRQRQG